MVPEALIPLTLMSPSPESSSVLCGDPRQLGPVVRCADAVLGGARAGGDARVSGVFGGGGLVVHPSQARVVGQLLWQTQCWEVRAPVGVLGIEPKAGGWVGVFAWRQSQVSVVPVTCCAGCSAGERKVHGCEVCPGRLLGISCGFGCLCRGVVLLQMQCWEVSERECRWKVRPCVQQYACVLAPRGPCWARVSCR